METRRIVALVAGLALVKLWLAARMGLIGDEVFYWQCSRHPAWGYADQPPATALLVGLGTMLLGDTRLGIRCLFLAVGSLLPLAVAGWGRAAGEEPGPGAGWVLALPLGAGLGLLAVPDAVLLPVTLVLAAALARAVREPSPRAWLGVGLAGAAGLALHFRILFTLAGAGLFFLATRRGRQLLATPGPWGAAALAALGLVPTVLFNAGNGWVAFAYQFVERHPWTFSPAGLLHPLRQAVVVTPGLYLLLLLALARLGRAAARGRVEAQLPCFLAGVHLGLVAGLAPFADTDTFTVHWPLPAYALLMPMLPGALAALARRSGTLARGLRAGALLGALLGGALLAVFALGTAFPERVPRTGLGDGPEARTLGWEVVAERVRGELAKLPAGTPVVVPKGWGAAELEFHLGGASETFLLDFSRRSGIRDRVQKLQYRLWERDGAGVGRYAGRDGLGVVTIETGRPFGVDAAPQVRALAGHCTELRRLDRFDLFDGGKRVAIFLMKGLRPAPAEPDPARVDWPVLAWVDAPAPGAGCREGLEVAGWACCDAGGVAGVEARVDGQGAGGVAYGLPRPDVRTGLAAGSRDPAHPAVGFGGRLALAGLAAGPHRLELRFTTGPGLVEDFGPIRFLVEAPPAR